MNALFHTMKNAIQYTPEGGTIYLRASVTDQEGMIAIQDTGSGIPAEDMLHIFKPLFRGKAHEHRSDGQGLGLPIVQRIVANHGGRVEVDSTPGIGSTFRLFFPLFHAS
jgi:signal transduction histidine kinase